METGYTFGVNSRFTLREKENDVFEVFSNDDRVRLVKHTDRQRGAVDVQFGRLGAVPAPPVVRSKWKLELEEYEDKETSQMDTSFVHELSVFVPN